MKMESLAEIASARAHHYDALSHLVDTADYYRKQRTIGVGREERHETLRHLAAIAKTTLDIEGEKSSQTVGERMREAVVLVRQA